MSTQTLTSTSDYWDRGPDTRRPLSAKSFRRSLPPRIGAVEDTVERHELTLDGVLARLAALEARPMPDVDPACDVRLCNVIAIIARLAEQVRRIDKRSAWTRRQVTVITDHQFK
jgi:hypothetical protein